MTESQAILAGVLISMALTPMLVSGWRKADPPDPSSRIELSSEAKQWCAGLEREAAWALLAFIVLIGSTWGWFTHLHKLAAVVFVSGLFAIPYLWTVSRCTLAGPRRTKEYTSYYQEKHGVGIRLASVVGIVSTYMLIVSLVIYELWLR